MDHTTVRESEFFRESTLRLCGTVEIEKALWRLFLYVKHIIPGDELVCVVYNQPLGLLEVVATADEKGGSVRSVKIPIPPDARRHVEGAKDSPPVRISEDVHRDPVAKWVARALDWPSSTIMINRLMIEGEMIGALYIRDNGRRPYTGEQAQLWKLINEPAAIALANGMRHREVASLKEMLADENRYLQEELRAPYSETIIGVDFGLREVMQGVRNVAPLASPVLLVGETGTGKEVIANAIHNLSPRSHGPFIKVNCGAIPESLVDSELFGHEKGAFTGALSQQRGRFERAHGGTIFLDEVSELPLHAQVRMLRVLQEKEIERVGGVTSIKVDVRIISATNRDLRALVADNLFRDDLYYRLCVFPIRIPPLRERKMDIPPMVEYFMGRKAREIGLSSMPELVPGTMEKLVEYHWPGNVRELSNAIERAIIIHGSRPVTFEDIVGMPAGGDGGESRRPAPEGREETLAGQEARHIRRVLERTAGRIEGEGGAAAILGVHPATLRSRMRKLGIPFGRAAKIAGAAVDPSRGEQGRRDERKR